jgi:hypothetical protein
MKRPRHGNWVWRLAGRVSIAAIAAIFLGIGAASAQGFEPWASGPTGEWTLRALGDNHLSDNTYHLSILGTLSSGNVESSGWLSILPWRTISSPPQTNSPTAIDIIIQTNDYYADDAVTCELTTPSDFTYTPGQAGLGTLVLTAASSECVQTDNGGPAKSSAGGQITFNVYVTGGEARIISTTSNFSDNFEEIDDPAIVGSVTPN